MPVSQTSDILLNAPARDAEGVRLGGSSVGAGHIMGLANSVIPPLAVAPPGVSAQAIPRSPAAERMRLHRERKKNGMRCVMIELRETEVEALIKLKLLKAEMRDGREAIVEAIYRWFEGELVE